MFQFHGWATLRSTPTIDDPPGQDPPAEMVARIRSLVDTDNGSNHTVDLRRANGALHLWIAGYHNHADRRVVALFERVAAIAPGSYGILYVFDDEDPLRGNEWVRYVMRRGEVIEEIDQSLSPHIGVVEDPWPT